MTIKQELQTQIIRNSSELAEVFYAVLNSEEEQDRMKEHFWIAGLDVKNRISYLELCSLGTMTSSLVHPREVFRLAIMKNVVSIVCVHNHPSGDPEPSKNDIDITKRLKSAGEILGINLLDHLIITGTGQYRYVSLIERGII